MIGDHAKTPTAVKLRKWRADRAEDGLRDKPRRNKTGLQATPEGKAQYMRDFGQGWRNRALMFFGGRCERCGNNDSRVLQFDHVLGGGVKDLMCGSRNSTQRARAVFQEPSKYQVLCANCNWIKKFERNENAGYLKRGGI